MDPARGAKNGWGSVAWPLSSKLLGGILDFKWELNMDNLFSRVYFLSLLPNLPLYLIWIIGLVLSIIHRKRHSKVCLLTMVSLSILFLLSLISKFLDLWLPINVFNEGYTAREIGATMMRIEVIASLVSTVAWSMLFAAMFGWRKQMLQSAT